MENKYNDIPVTYCKSCLSLLVINYEDEDNKRGCYCSECSSSDLQECHIDEWEKIFEEQNGYNYLIGDKRKIWEKIRKLETWK